MKLLPLNKGKFALVDDQFLPVLTAMGQWRYSASGYALIYARNSAGQRRALYLHRVVMALILGHPVGHMQVDHINSNRLDARAENLRLATASENQAAKKSQKNSRSGQKGVTRRGQKFDVRLRFYRHRVNLGRYSDFELAVAIYQQAHAALWKSYTSEPKSEVLLPAAIQAKIDQQIAALLKKVSMTC